MSDLTQLPQPGAPCLPAGVTDAHGKDAFIVRFGTAMQEAARTGAVTHTANGDEALYPDRRATYTKGLLQDAPGIVNPATYTAFKTALGNGNFESPALKLGGDRKLNGPLGGFAYTLCGADSRSFGDTDVAPPPRLASAAYATELVELYWASLLRDVPFADYANNAAAGAAAAEMTALQASYAGPTRGGVVTPDLLFRGPFVGETAGPYVSQLCIVPTALGALSIDQRVATYWPGLDYMKDLDSWAAVQNGVSPATRNVADPAPRYMNNGRALAAYTHVDELYQAYLVAYLVLQTLKIGPNKGSPYRAYAHQQAFGTFGGPDISATLAAVARIALDAVWYQKWNVHLRHRPESGGGIVHLVKTVPGHPFSGTLDHRVLDSQAVALSQQRFGTYLLAQAFPEGSPTHPAYPTGHGTVAGACITVLKFFFDGGAIIPNPQVPSSDGLKLVPYAGNDSEQLTVNGELNKLACNISFGHGIHGGIHWRSDTDASIRLGEAVALKYLQDQAYTYRENFAISLVTVDGATRTIANH